VDKFKDNKKTALTNIENVIRGSDYGVMVIEKK